MKHMTRCNQQQQQSIKQRTTADQKRLIQAEQQDRRKFIDSTESEANTEEFRQSKRSTLEVAANAAKDKNFQELVRKRQNHVWQREAASREFHHRLWWGKEQAVFLSSFLIIFPPSLSLSLSLSLCLSSAAGFPFISSIE